MSAPFFSLVMAAYNAQDFIKDSIQSIFAQTCGDFELIVVNDGSTDQTGELLAQLAAQDSRLRPITPTDSAGQPCNIGPGAARNLGIAAAQGEYLCIIDSDDSLEPDYLESFRRQIEEHHCDLAVCGYWMEPEGSPAALFSHNAALAQSHSEFLDLLPPLMTRQLMYVCWNKVYRREIIEEHQIRFRDWKSCEDRMFNLEVYRHVEQFSFDPNPHYHYLIREGQGLNSKYLPDRLETLVSFQKELLSLFEDGGKLTPEHHSDFAQIFVKGLMACFVSLYHPSCPLSRREKSAFIKQSLSDPWAQEEISRCHSGGIKVKGMGFIFRTRWVWLTKLAAKLLYWISEKASGLFLKLKYHKK